MASVRNRIVQGDDYSVLPVPLVRLGHRLRWSLSRRRHQAHARACHYHPQAATGRASPPSLQYPTPYAEPVTLKSLLTKMWCGLLVPILWTAYEPSLSCSIRLTVPSG